MFRLWLEPDVVATPGGEFTVGVYVDHGAAEGVEAAIGGDLLAIMFGIAHSADLELLGSSLDETDSASLIDEDTIHSVVSVAGGSRFGLVYSNQLERRLPAGFGHRVATLRFAASDEAEVGAVYTLAFDEEIGDGRVGCELTVPRGRVFPTMIDTTVRIESSGFAGAASLVDSPPLMDSDDHDFEAFTNPETLAASAANFVESSPCEALEDFVVSELPAPTRGTAVNDDVDGTGGIQTEINAAYAYGGAGPYVIAVDPGTYGNITVDVASLPVDLVIYATTSLGDPDPASSPFPRTTILGPIAGAAIQVVDSSPPSTSRSVQIGLAKTDALKWAGLELLGMSDQSIYTELHGFEVTPFTSVGSGIIVDEVQGHEVDLVGNWIHGFKASGVVVDRSSQVRLVLNDVVDNLGHVGIGLVPGVSAGFGGGVAVYASDVKILGNWIRSNSFRTGETEYRYGGGVAIVSDRGVVEDIVINETEVALCQNWIYDNEATQGCGVFCVDLGEDSAARAVHHLERNRIFENSYFDEPFPAFTSALISGHEGLLGGGVAVLKRVSAVNDPDADGSYEPTLLNNEIHGNNIHADSGTLGSDEVGGGIYASFMFTVDALYWQGNMVYENLANAEGGGAHLSPYYYGSGMSPGSLVLHNNTLSYNRLLGTGTVFGRGLFVRGPVTGVGYPLIDARNNVIRLNQGSIQSQWHVQCSTALTPPSLAWSYNQRPTETTNCSTLGNYNPFAGGTANDGLDPQLRAPSTSPNGNSPYILFGMVSPCIDSGDPSATDVVLLEDYEGEARIDNSDLDRSADERGELRFVRGDANNSEILDVADAIFILNYVTSSGPAPTCADAADANDDGVINIADASYLFSYTSAYGFPPPPPFDECGSDPTADALACSSGSVCES